MNTELDEKDKIIISTLENNGRQYGNYRKTLTYSELKKLSVKGGVGERNFSTHLKHTKPIKRIVIKKHPPRTVYVLKDSKINLDTDYLKLKDAIDKIMLVKKNDGKYFYKDYFPEDLHKIAVECGIPEDSSKFKKLFIKLEKKLKLKPFSPHYDF